MIWLGEALEGEEEVGQESRKKEGDFGKKMIVRESNLLAIRWNPAKHWGIIPSQRTEPKSFNVISSVRPEPAFEASFAAALIDVIFNPHPAERHLQITPQ
jgi:hypothetical protein